MLGFECIGALKTNMAVSAPSQLMRIKVQKIGENIDQLAGKFGKSGRSLYPYFFNKKEEAGVRQRIARLTNDTGRAVEDSLSDSKPQIYLRCAA
ncbi:hypothetical protein A9995_15285 [Erythrobacter sp. QSSC1-22B]|nr:hypothetical protein A9995_15285 [Erythrobacter sp. QSSC1-22B]